MAQCSTVLDIGSSKVICLICTPVGRDGVVVRGAGIKEYQGYRLGEFEDENHLAAAVSAAVTAAENESSTRIGRLSVGVPAPFSKVIVQHVGLELGGKRINERLMERLINESLDFEQPEGYTLMHSTPFEFMIDGAYRGEIPIGVTAKTVHAAVSHVFVRDSLRRVVTDALAKHGLRADMFIAVPLADALFLIPERVRADRALLIDVGYTHTDVALIRNAALAAVRTVDAGGRHFASDLAYATQLPLSVTENTKRRYVYSLDYQDTIDTIRLSGGKVIKVDHEVVQYVIEERTRELCDLIREAAADMGAASLADIPVYLTGGGVTLMRGSCEFMEAYLGIPIRVSMPWMPRLSSPNYSSAFSVMDFVLKADSDDVAGVVGSHGGGRLVRKIVDFFTE